MNDKDNGGPAFPWGEHGTHLGGMSLRDYFAAKAMQAAMHGAVLPTKQDRDKWLPIAGEFAYEVADHMLKARGA